MTVCANCGNQAGEGAVFCDQCGARLPVPEISEPSPRSGAVTEAAPAEVSPGAPQAQGHVGSVICVACGAGNVPGEAFCDFCGSPLEAPVPADEAAPPLEPASSEAELEATVQAPAGEAAPSAEVETPQAGEPAPLGPELPLTCPACGAEVMPGEAFCADCGASLALPPIPPELVSDLEEEPERPMVEQTVETVPSVSVPAAGEVEPEPAAEGVPDAVHAPPPQAAITVCPACSEEIEPGDKFCSNCGAVLQPPAVAVPAEHVAPVQPPLPSGPRLIVSASGGEIPLPQAEEILIGREDPVSGIFPDVDLTPHGGEAGGVSRRHARLVVEGGETYIEDLDSTNYTFVNKQKLVAGSRLALKDGDEIRCGRVALVFKA